MTESTPYLLWDETIYPSFYCPEQVDEPLKLCVNQIKKIIKVIHFSVVGSNISNTTYTYFETILIIASLTSRCNEQRTTKVLSLGQIIINCQCPLHT